MAERNGLSDRFEIDGPTAQELTRITGVLRQVGGTNVQWGAKDALDVWVAETRLQADREAASQLLFATWVLAAATVALVLATVGLIVVAVTA